MRNLSRYLLIILVQPAFTSVAYGGTETLVPEDTLSVENSWFTNALGGKVSSVTDDTDALYIYDNTGGLSQRFTITDESSIPTGATIDSFVVLLRAQKATASTTRIRNRIRMDGNTNYCDGGNKTLTTSWDFYSEKFTASPTSGGTCAGSLTKERIDSLNIQLLGTLVPLGGEARVTDIDVVVHFTESGSVPEKSRRRRIILLSNHEDNGYETFVNFGAICHSYNIVFAEARPWLWHSQQ